MVIPLIKPWTDFSKAEVMYRRYFRNRNITFDKTMWMDWDEKIRMCILVIKFLETYYFEYDKISLSHPFILKKSFSLKGKSIEIREVMKYGFHAGYEFHLSTFWDYEVGVGAQNIRSGKFNLHSKALDWFYDLLYKMQNKIGEQAASAIINRYKLLCESTNIISL